MLKKRLKVRELPFKYKEKYTIIECVDTPRGLGIIQYIHDSPNGNRIFGIKLPASKEPNIIHKMNESQIQIKEVSSLILEIYLLSNKLVKRFYHLRTIGFQKKK